MDTSEPILPSLPDGQPSGPDGPNHPVHPNRRWVVALVVVSMVLVAAGIIARYVELPYDTLAPGSARAVNSAVDVKGHATYPPEGKVLYVTVSVRERVNPYEALAGWLDPATDVIPETQVRGTIPPDQYDRMNVEAMADSKTTAEVLALRRLGYTDLGAGAEVVEVQAGLPAAAVLKANDVIVGVDGKSVSNSGDAVNAIKGHVPGDQLVLRIRRDDGPPTDVSATLAKGDDGKALLGVRLSTKIKLPFDVNIDSGRVVGPSAGLAYALELLDVLTPGELTGGSAVAATGELMSDGTVGPIGGIAQKTVTVRRAGATVFLVPKANEAEARAHAGSKLQIRGVGSFDEALQALGSLAGSNALALGKPPAGA